MWEATLLDFDDFLLLEKASAENTREAYLRDVSRLMQFAAMQRSPEWHVSPEAISAKQLQAFAEYLYELGLSTASASRTLSGVRAFYRFLLLTDRIADNPTKLLEMPASEHKLPTVLSVEEVEAIFAVVREFKNVTLRRRNEAMIELLYACGFRVSELLSLKLSAVLWKMGVIKVVGGKGNKERLVPVGESALEALQFYLTAPDGRTALPIKSGAEDYIFLNQNGGTLTRQQVFMLVQGWAKKAGIEKRVSPHTLRHTFATHLFEGGADLRAIQSMLGHEYITTTEIYSHMDMSFLREQIYLHPRNKAATRK